MAYWDIIIYDGENITLDADEYEDEDAIEKYMDEHYPDSQYQAEYND